MKLTIETTDTDDGRAQLDRVLSALQSSAGNTAPLPGHEFRAAGIAYQLVDRCSVSEVCARLRSGWAVADHIAVDTVLFARPALPVGMPSPGAGMERIHIRGHAQPDDVRAALAMWTFERWADGGGFFATRVVGP